MPADNNTEPSDRELVDPAIDALVAIERRSGLPRGWGEVAAVITGLKKIRCSGDASRSRRRQNLATRVPRHGKLSAGYQQRDGDQDRDQFYSLAGPVG